MGRRALEQPASGFAAVRVPDDTGGGWVLLRFEVAPDGTLQAVHTVGDAKTKRPYVWPTRGGRLRAVRHSLHVEKMAEINAARAEIAARDAEIKRLRSLVGDIAAANQPPHVLAAASL